MLPREPRQAFAQNFPAMLDLEGDFRRVSGIADVPAVLVGYRGLRATAELGQRLVTGNCQQPGRDRRAGLEPVSLLPHAEKHVASEILRRRNVSHHPQDETVYAGVVPREQGLHREPVTGRDFGYQRLIRGIRALPRRPVSRNVVVRPGEIVAHTQPPSLMAYD